MVIGADLAEVRGADRTQTGAVLATQDLRGQAEHQRVAGPRGNVEDLLASHQGVEEVAVVGVEDSEFGQRLRAFVVARNGAELTEAEVKEFVRENLARFKVPRDVVFVDVLPRNATGKVLKRDLRLR